MAIDYDQTFADARHEVWDLMHHCRLNNGSDHRASDLFRSAIGLMDAAQDLQKEIPSIHDARNKILVAIKEVVETLRQFEPGYEDQCDKCRGH